MSDPLAVRLRSEHSTITEQLMAAKLIDSLVEENEKLRASQSDDPGEVRFSASEGACYAYPGEDQAALRQAFCDGAVYTRTGNLPD